MQILKLIAQKNVSLVLRVRQIKLECLVPQSFFLARLMFASKAGAYHCVANFGAY
jgi:hypothetical protein